MSDLERYGSCTLDQDGCTTCGDLAIPVKVVEVRGDVALCEDRLGQRAKIALNFVPETSPGDVLLMHLGVAIARVEGAA